MIGNVHLRTDYFRHRNAEKYSCLTLPIFLNNTRNALAGVKLAGAFLVDTPAPGVCRSLFPRGNVLKAEIVRLVTGLGVLEQHPV